jgi:carbamoyl-phosphate synthase large subunit
LLLDHYLDGAIEAEADAICDGENVYIIELWSTSNLVVTLEIVMQPPFNLGEFVMQQIKTILRK